MDESKAEVTCNDVAGVWQRLFEEDPIGDIDNADRTTFVYWMQVPGVTGTYIDLRLPKESLKLQDNETLNKNPTSLIGCGFNTRHSNNDEYLLQILCNQKSFAGQLIYCKGDTSTTNHGQAISKDKVLSSYVKANPHTLCTCYWKRFIDYQPPTGGLDIGICATDPTTMVVSNVGKTTNNGSSIDIRETGDDGSYAEGWRRLPNTHDEGGPYFAMELQSENDIVDGRKGYWIRVGNYFAYAIGRPINADLATKLQYCNKSSWKVNNDQTIVGQGLKDAIETITASEKDEGNTANEKQKQQLLLEEQLSIVGSYVCCMGKINSDNDDDQHHKWKILYSTHPELVGCYLLGKKNQDEAIVDSTLCCSWVNVDGGGAAASNSSETLPPKLLQVGNTLTQHIVAGNINETSSPTSSIVRKWKIIEASSG